MKTALDWLIEQMPYEFRANHTQEIFRQAKEKEKEHIVDAYENGSDHGIDVIEHGLDYFHGEEYYNEKYNQNK